MTVKRLLASAAKKLQPRRITCPADRNVGWLEAEILLAHVLKRDRTWLTAHADDRVPVPAARKFQSLAARRVKREPVAYLLGVKDFFGRPFVVNRHVLIPRPETEMLVEMAKRRMSPADRAIFWDVGTGSGAVGVTLAAEIPQSSVIATDISTNAVKVAGANANRHGVSDRMHILKANLLDANVLRLIRRHAKARPLVIAANLPYLPNADRNKLDADVVKYEPNDALFAGKDGIAINRQFLGQVAASGLMPQAMLLEFDPPQAARLKALAKKTFPSATVAVHKDLAGRNRVLEIRPR
ncbi:MAG TPA: peptide chain release factor N(5)-glutamine methyltransferase [Candidatus Methylomirabilis sp.]|nr:peptide chain release factor N(5)-glutamine methyltransferase [Candidatus Methylomirabilis sp.]